MPPLYEDAKREVDDEGNIHYASIDGALTVCNDGTEPPNAFLRTAMRVGDPPEGKERKTRVMVGHLDGVYCFVQGNQVVLSKRNLMP